MVVHQVEIEIAVLIEVKPARHERDRGRTNGLQRLRLVLEGISVLVTEQPVFAHAGEERTRNSRITTATTRCPRRLRMRGRSPTKVVPRRNGSQNWARAGWLRRRSRVNHGGDSDSTGAVTGNLRGTIEGAGAIPRKWLDGLELREEIENMADDLYAAAHGRELPTEKYPTY